MFDIKRGKSMATEGAFDGKRALRSAIPAGLKLDQGAQAKLDQLIRNAAPRLAEESNRAHDAQSALRPRHMPRKGLYIAYLSLHP